MSALQSAAANELPTLAIVAATTAEPIAQTDTPKLAGEPADLADAESAGQPAAKLPLFHSVTLQALQSGTDDQRGLMVKNNDGNGAAADFSIGSEPSANGRQSLESPRRAGSADDSAQISDASSQSSATAPSSQPLTLSAPAAPDNGAAVAQSSLQERIDVARQLASRISAAAATGIVSANGAARKITVDISPQHWGRMQITLTQTPADAGGISQASATIVTESESARQALLGQVKDLRESLRAGGVKIDKIEIVAASKASPVSTAVSAVAGVAGADAGSLSGNARQQQQSRQHPEHFAARFEFGSGTSGAGADASGSQNRRQHPGFESDAGGRVSYQSLGFSSQGETNIPGSGPSARATALNAGIDTGVNVLA